MYEEDAISLGDDEPIAHEPFADDEFDEINTMVLDHYNATSMAMDAEASLFRQVPSARMLIDTDTLPLHVRYTPADGLISWTSRAQKTIAYSSTEAEYMALSDCACHVTWIQSLLGELGYKLKAIPICGDNQGSIFMASNPVMEPCSKHIDIRYHGIRESVAKGNVELFFIDGAENPADLLTKNLPREKFAKFRAQLGLQFPSGST